MSKKVIKRRRPDVVETTVAPKIERPKPIRDPRPQKKHSLDGDALLAELDAFEMDNFLSGSRLKHFNVGDSVEGTVTSFDKEVAFIDIGGKSEATMTLGPEDAFSIGSSINATVIRADGRGIIIAQRLSQSNDIEAFQEAYDHGIPVKGTVKNSNSGGYTISLGAIQGFCPRSQIDIHSMGEEEYIGNSYDFQITELKSRDVILSRRALLQKEREAGRTALLSSLTIGQELEGRVVRLTDFGAFVDIGGIDGLIGHRTIQRFGVELISGQEILVSIDDIKGERISLSLPNHDPWLKLGSKYLVGEIYSGTIAKRMDFGVFVRLEAGLEGLVHRSNLSEDPNESPLQFKEQGQSIQTKLLSFDLNTRRISLGIRQLNEEYHASLPEQAPKKNTTFGDAFAHILSQLKDN